MYALLKKTLFALLAAALLAGVGQAQAKTLDAGTFYLEPKVGIYGNSNSRVSSMFTYGAEAGFFVIEGLSFGVEGLGYVITQKRNPWWNGNGNYETVNAFSPIAIVRYHFVNEDKFNVFGGIGLGGFFSQVPVPRDGYSSNLTEIAELGMNMFLTDHVSVQLAGRWQHIGPYSSQGSDNWGGNLAVKYAF
ncbi:hypothetical protein NNJEOMEG_03938 [Fundidesulfovibrio magnetotacticus]|uniref:Lipid A 3-O-deacylase (PagL) n=1 Tax=Fundidesulfovibrio magnetotacticus TaxID=2730080 RepID=A0A6V8LWF2_9BACT|nr:hypothetical protein [Fundidesulfovibrio magnetotacticus]GFK96064.1 hypothetical protein NNJEOMEG_03938 [Fundidesulfovibrio magnetotacticus]